MNFFKIVLISMYLVLLGACGERVVVETNEIGRILGKNGLGEKIIEPKSFRLPLCYAWQACSKLVVLETSKHTVQLDIDTLFLPKSNVDITNVKIGVQFEVPLGDMVIYDEIYANVKSEKESSRVRRITSGKLWEIYLERIIPNAIVTSLRNNTVEEILSDIPEISAYTHEQVNKLVRLSSIPVIITEIGFPDGIGRVPDVVLKSKRDLYAVKEQKARDIKALQAQLIIEKHRQAVQSLRAKNDLVNANSLDVPVLQFINAKTLERFADAAEDGDLTAFGFGAHVLSGIK